MPEFQPAFKGSIALLGGVLLLSSLSATGCMFSHAKPAPRAFRPPPVQVQPVALADVFIEESGPDLDIEVPQNPADSTTLRMPEFPGPPKPAASPKPPPVKAAAPQPESPTAPPPNIRQLFTADQRNDLNRSYGGFLSMVARDLETLSKKKLSADQNSDVERIRTFKRQAEEQFRVDDLVTAVELARRAFVLAEDLLSRVR